MYLRLEIETEQDQVELGDLSVVEGERLIND